MKQSNKNRKPIVMDDPIQEYIDNDKPLPIYLLAEVASQSPSGYQTVISKEFQGHHMVFGKSRFSKRRALNREKEVEMNRQVSETIEREYEFAKKKVAESDEILKEKKAIFEEKKNEYLQANRAMEVARKELEEAERVLVTNREIEEWYLQEYMNTLSIGDELRKVALVHRSASIQQLKKLQYRYFIMTNHDEKFAHIIGVADEIFDSEDNLVTEIPYWMLKRDLTDEEKSALAFCNMVIHFYLEGAEYELVYADKLVAELLRINGVID